MKFSLRSVTVLLPLPLLLSLCTPAYASSNDENILDAQAVAQLELRAQQAGPRDQCFLYTELVNTMTEMAGKQMLNGDIDQASATLKKVNQYAQLIHMDLASNSKRLKNAEMLMHHTTYRLSEYLHKASSEDQDTIKVTLKQLNKVHEELLAEVFKH
jgi:DNA mismatch repair ATPase MutS